MLRLGPAILRVLDVKDSTTLDNIARHGLPNVPLAPKGTRPLTSA